MTTALPRTYWRVEHPEVAPAWWARPACEPGPGGDREQPGRVGAQHDCGALSGVAEQTLKHAVEARPVTGRDCRNGGRGKLAIEVDPGACGEVGRDRAGVEQGLALAGHD